MYNYRPLGVKLDSSALIDARIADLSATGIIQVPIIIPRFVISELHTLADSADKLKRGRGRRGLEVISRLQRSGLDLSIDETQQHQPGRRRPGIRLLTLRCIIEVEHILRDEAEHGGFRAVPSTEFVSQVACRREVRDLQALLFRLCRHGALFHLSADDPAPGA